MPQRRKPPATPTIGELPQVKDLDQLVSTVNDRFRTLNGKLQSVVTNPAATETDVDVSANRIVNVGDPRNDTDAVNLRTLHAIKTTLEGGGEKVDTAALIALVKKLIAGIVIESNFIPNLVNDGVISEGNATMVSGSHVLTIGQDSFDVAQEGNPITVSGAGSGGGPLFTSILSVDSASQATLLDAASTSVTLQTAMWGTDNSAAIADAVTAADGVGELRFPVGTYATTDTLGLQSDTGTYLISGCGYASTVLCFMDPSKHGVNGSGGSESGLRNCAFRDIYLKGPGNGGVVSEPGGGGDPLNNIGVNFWYGCNWWSFHNVRVRGFGTGLVFTNSNSGTAVNLISEYNMGDGVRCDGEPVNHIGSHGSSFVGCKFRKNLGRGAAVFDSVNVTFDASCITEGNGGGGILVGSGAIATQVHNTYFESNVLWDVLIDKTVSGGSDLPVLGTSIKGNYCNPDAFGFIIGAGSVETKIEANTWPFTGGSRTLHVTSGTGTTLTFPGNYQLYWNNYAINIPGGGVDGADLLTFVTAVDPDLSTVTIQDALSTDVSDIDILIAQRPIILREGAANTFIGQNRNEKLTYVETDGTDTGTAIVGNDNRTYEMQIPRLWITDRFGSYPTDILDMAEIHNYSGADGSVRRTTTQAGAKWVQLYAREDSGVALTWKLGVSMSIGPTSNIASADSYPKISFDADNPGKITITTQDPDADAFLQVIFKNAPNQGANDLAQWLVAGVVQARIASDGSPVAELGWTAGDGTSGTCNIRSGGSGNAGYIEWNTAGGSPHRIAYQGYYDDGHLHLNLGQNANYIIRAQDSTSTPTLLCVDQSDAQDEEHMVEFRDASETVLSYIDYQGNFSGSSASSGGAAPTGAAGGDLDGTYPNPDVVKIQGRDVYDVNPMDGDVLTWDNALTRWEPTAPASGAPASASYITQQAEAGLSGEQSLGALTTGILKNTVTAGVGVLSKAGFADLPTPGAPTSFTPTASNLTSSSGAAGLYIDWGSVAFIQLTITGTPTNTANAVVITLPFTPSTNRQALSIWMTTGGSLVGGTGDISGTSLSVKYANPTSFQNASHVFTVGGYIFK